MKKDVVLVILGLLVVGLSVFLARSLEQERRAVKGLEEERYSRMVAEESLQKNAAKLSTMQEQIKSTSDKMAKIQDIVDQEKGVNADLKKQYAQLAEAKEALEAKVKAAVQEQKAPALVQTKASRK